MIDNFRWMMFPSYNTASEMTSWSLSGRGVNKARERLNSERTFYAMGGWRGDVGDSWVK